MALLFSDEEMEFREKAQDFIRREVVPKVDEIEKDNVFPKEIIRNLGKEGFLGIMHPREYGGSDKGMVYEIILAEEISSVVPSLDMSRMTSATLYGISINRNATDAQKREYLTPIIEGKKIGAIAITEPNAGSDVSGMETRAEKDGNDWIINGEKRFITNGSVSDYMILFAITDPNVDPRKGMTAFIIECDKPGFKVIKDYDLMGMKGCRNTHFSLEDYRIGEENVLREPNEGFRILMDELDSERVAIAGEAVGYARGAFETAVKYSTERVQFKRPISKFEAISFRIADMGVKIEAARLLTLRAARMVDRGLRATKEASMAKLFATEMAFQVCDDALQVLGGIGYTNEAVVEKLMRDSRLMRIGGGTSEVQRFVIQREIYKELEEKNQKGS
ncbi:MAG: acyl-CoA dehydrogenase family protein [Promethearchaeota archaeon]